MKTRILSLALMLFMLCIVSSCRDQKTTNVAVTKDGIVMHKHDTIQVMNLVTEFMNALKNKEYANAVIMLYEINPQSPYDEPELLDNEKIEKTLDGLKKFPIRNFEFKDFTFTKAYDNLVRFDVELDSQSQNTEPIKVVFALKPVRYLGEWRLCLK